MSRLSLLAEESARENATAFDWAEGSATQALIARWLFADDILQAIAGHDLTRAEDTLSEELDDIELSLEAIRDDRISVEIGTLSEHDQDDDYLIDEIGGSAPRVADVLETARKDARLADALSLAPVTRVSATRIAA